MCHVDGTMASSSSGWAHYLTGQKKRKRMLNIFEQMESAPNGKSLKRKINLIQREENDFL